MGIFDGVFKTATNLGADAIRYGVRGNKAINTPMKGGKIQMNENFTENFAHKVGNNGFLQGIRGFANISDSPVGARTQGQIASEFGARQKNYQHDAKRTLANIATLKKGMASTGDDAAAMGVYQGQLAKANGQMMGIRFKQAGAGLQQAAAHTYRAGAYALAEGTIAERAMKTAGIGGTVAGANGMARGVSGGGMTYNNSGERDIAGIPFL